MNTMVGKILKVLGIGIVVLTLNSCAPGSDDPGPVPPGSYFMRFNVNGVKKEYKMLSSAAIYYNKDYSIYHGDVVASLTSDYYKEVMSLFVVDKNEIGAGKNYEVKNIVEIGSPAAIWSQLKIVYLDKDGEPYTAIIPDSDVYDELNGKDEGTLLFTEVTDSYVKGTFSGKVFNDFPRGDALEITDGEFFLERIK